MHAGSTEHRAKHLLKVMIAVLNARRKHGRSAVLNVRRKY